MDDPYNKREQDMRHEIVIEKIDDLHSELKMRMDSFEDETSATLGRIEKKQDYTNGKVGFLYRWFWVGVGFCTCISILLLPLIWILISTGKLL